MTALGAHEATSLFRSLYHDSKFVAMLIEFHSGGEILFRIYGSKFHSRLRDVWYSPMEHCEISH